MKKKDFTRRRFISTLSVGSAAAVVSSAIPTFGNITTKNDYTDTAGSRKFFTDSTPSGLKLSIFDIDATPRVGSHLAYDTMIGSWDMGLRARGIVLLGAGQPVVLKVQDTALLGINAEQLAWIQRCKAGKMINVACLTLNHARILYLPGELFVEYQLAAKAERKDLFVAMAAYGDYGPGYIGTAIAYEQGDYEAGTASRVSPEVEGVLLTAIRRLLNDKP